MRIYLAVLLLYGVQVACQYSFVALDQAPKAIFLTVWRKIILLIPLIFLLPHLWPDAVMGFYLAEPIADTIAICTTAPMFYLYYKIENRRPILPKKMKRSESLSDWKQVRIFLPDGMNYFRLVSRLSSITARTMMPMTRIMPTIPMSIMGSVVIHEER